MSPLRFRPLSRAKEGFSLPLDSAVGDEVKGWLKRAASDLRTAELVRNGSPPELGAAVFHCQQVAEKALKALLTVPSRSRSTHGNFATPESKTNRRPKKQTKRSTSREKSCPQSGRESPLKRPPELAPRSAGSARTAALA